MKNKTILCFAYPLQSFVLYSDTNCDRPLLYDISDVNRFSMQWVPGPRSGLLGGSQGNCMGPTTIKRTILIKCVIFNKV